MGLRNDGRAIWVDCSGAALVGRASCAVRMDAGPHGRRLPRSWKGAVVFTHISFGLVVLALLLGRLGWRMAAPRRRRSRRRSIRGGDVAALAVHVLLYALLLMVPVTGIVLQFARGQSVPLFGLCEIASPWVRDRAWPAR